MFDEANTQRQVSRKTTRVTWSRFVFVHMFENASSESRRHCFRRHLSGLGSTVPPLTVRCKLLRHVLHHARIRRQGYAVNVPAKKKILEQSQQQVGHPSPLHDGWDDEGASTPTVFPKHCTIFGSSIPRCRVSSPIPRA